MSRSHDPARPDSAASAAQRQTAIIRDLNDQLRRLMAGGRVVITPGIQALPSDLFAIMLRRICRFADFTADNDPHGEHDFGAVEVAGLRIFWKIDCYDKTLEFGSPDPGDPAVTTRVMTIMLAEEY